MVYSCFNAKAGVYDLYESGEQKPVNGDLPVPTFGHDAGKIGVPASEAGRPLPSGAKKVGQSWNAKGIVVTCEAAMAGLGGETVDFLEQHWWHVLAGVMGCAAGYFAMRRFG